MPARGRPRRCRHCGLAGGRAGRHGRLCRRLPPAFRILAPLLRPAGAPAAQASPERSGASGGGMPARCRPPAAGELSRKPCGSALRQAHRRALPLRPARGAGVRSGRSRAGPCTDARGGRGGSGPEPGRQGRPGGRSGHPARAFSGERAGGLASLPRHAAAPPGNGGAPAAARGRRRRGPRAGPRRAQRQGGPC